MLPPFRHRSSIPSLFYIDHHFLLHFAGTFWKRLSIPPEPFHFSTYYQGFRLFEGKKWSLEKLLSITQVYRLKRPEKVVKTYRVYLR